MDAMRRILIFLALLPVFAQSPSDRIGTIDFYGYGHLDLAALRAALPFKEGDKVPAGGARDRDLQAVNRIAGRKALFSGVCCLEDGRSSIYIGLPEIDAPPLAFNPQPQGDARLPASAMGILRGFEDDFSKAVKRGAAGEDDSQGYALFEDPATHADQLKLLAWTRGHLPIVLKVLQESRDARQRAYAAQALGYAERSPEQIAALVTAAFDSDDDVRNNGMRALQALCAPGKEVASQIPAARFVPLLHSIDWTDRNKGAMLFDRMTVGRDPAILKLLHDQALEPLREMAQWKDFGHAWFAIRILGRIGGIEESRLDSLSPAMVPEILRAAQ